MRCAQWVHTRTVIRRSKVTHGVVCPERNGLLNSRSRTSRNSDPEHMGQKIGSPFAKYSPGPWRPIAALDARFSLLKNDIPPLTLPGSLTDWSSAAAASRPPASGASCLSAQMRTAAILCWLARCPRACEFSARPKRPPREDELRLPARGAMRSGRKAPLARRHPNLGMTCRTRERLSPDPCGPR